MKEDTSTVRLRSPQATNKIANQILTKLESIESILKNKDDKPLTFREACKYLGYTRSYLYKLTYRKVIPHYKPTGKMIFFSKNELDHWIFESRCKAQGAKNEDGGSTSLTTVDPNQIEMELKEEVVIEFPLKSRRKKVQSAFSSQQLENN